MGDVRYEKALERVLREGTAGLGALSDAELIQALAALAGRQEHGEPYLANVLASEAMNRLARQDAALMSTGEGILAVDPEGIAVFANPAAEATLGWARTELRGVDVHALLHPAVEDAACDLHRALLGEGAPRRGVALVTRKGGAPVSLSFSIAPVVRDAEPAGTVLAFHALA